MLEKGKGPVLGKLWTMQLVEVDLQLVMQIFMKYRKSSKLEIDNRILKFNFGSRKGYSIDNALLEKRLLYDSSIITRKKSTYVVTDLVAYYDRQLLHIEILVMESVEIDRKFTIIMANYS